MVIVHHDRPQACAATVAAFDRLPEVGSVCVVESSTDGANAEHLRRLLPDAEIVDGGGNIGFGPGANLGLRRWLDTGTGDWVGIAPHDAIPAPDAIARIMDAVADRPDAGLACAEFGPDYALLPVVDKVMGGYYRPATRGVGWQDVDYPHGTLLVARRTTLDDIGLFDERYFAYCEEVDLGLRARDRGWSVGLVWGAIVTNGRLPPQLLADYLQLRNTLLLVHSRFERRDVRARVILAVLAIAARAVRDRRLGILHVRLGARALLDYRRRRFGPPPAAVVALARRDSRDATTVDASDPVPAEPSRLRTAAERPPRGRDPGHGRKAPGGVG
jgi:N-acetylglucosaminyl-diphospho-decaprenol L-rhamnosyltransferase